MHTVIIRQAGDSAIRRSAQSDTTLMREATSVPYRWNRFRRVDPAYYVLFERSGGFVVAATDALHVPFQQDRIDEASFAALDEIEHKADTNTHDALSRLECG